MSGTVRAEAPGRLLELVRALGGSPERVLAAGGVTADDFADPDRPIEVEVVLRLIDAAAHEVGDDRFGLHAGSRMDYGALGVLTYAVLNAPTVGTALRNFERYARSHFRGPRIRLEIDGDEARLELVLDGADGVARRGADCHRELGLRRSSGHRGRRATARPERPHPPAPARGATDRLQDPRRGRPPRARAPLPGGWPDTPHRRRLSGRVLGAERLWPCVSPLDRFDPARRAPEPDHRRHAAGTGAGWHRL